MVQIRVEAGLLKAPDMVVRASRPTVLSLSPDCDLIYKLMETTSYPLKSIPPFFEQTAGLHFPSSLAGKFVLVSEFFSRM